MYASSWDCIQSSRQDGLHKTELYGNSWWQGNYLQNLLAMFWEDSFKSSKSCMLLPQYPFAQFPSKSIFVTCYLKIINTFQKLILNCLRNSKTAFTILAGKEALELLIKTKFGKSILQVPDTGTRVLDNTRPFLHSSIVSF